MIGYPIVWEATARFGAFTPPESAAVLGALTAAALLVAASRDLRSLAWIVTIGAMASAFGLAVATGWWASYTVLVIALGTAALWLGYLREWVFLRWPVAGLANLMVLGLAARAGRVDAPRVVLLVQVLMLAAYLGSFAARTLVLGRDVIPFEVVQSVAALAVAFGGAIYVIQSTGSGVEAVGLVSLVFAGCAYAVAFAFVERRRQPANFFFYTSLALTFAVVGIGLRFTDAAAALAYGVVAVVAATLARRYARLALSLHAALYLVAAAIASGLVAVATSALLAPANTAWPPLGVPAWLALAAAGAIAARPVVEPVEQWGAYGRLPRLLLFVVLTWSAAGALVASLAPMLTDPARGADPSVIATLRTAILVVATLALAWLARFEEGREGGWLVYPLLAFAGLKVLAEDLPKGRPSTLFITLALYGGALIAGPWLIRRAGERRNASAAKAAAWISRPDPVQ
jgi:hypothetical protein